MTLKRRSCLREKLQNLDLASDVKTEIKRQINRLERTSPDSMEAAVIRNYLEWIFGLPWGVHTPDNLDIEHAKSVLDADQRP